MGARHSEIQSQRRRLREVNSVYLILLIFALRTLRVERLIQLDDG